MEPAPSRIGPLTKVRLELTFSQDASKGSQPRSMSYAFIYGLGVDGITPFEKALFGKSPGDSIDSLVDDVDFRSFFGHLACDLAQDVHIAAPFGLKARVVSITAADQREVVRAMAASSGCGGDCDCGCGC
jgi:hypothetical protein